MKMIDKLYAVEHSSVPGFKKNISYINATNEKEAANKVEGVVYNVREVKNKDNKTIDRAIRACDAFFIKKGDVFKNNIGERIEIISTNGPKIEVNKNGHYASMMMQALEDYIKSRNFTKEN